MVLDQIPPELLLLIGRAVRSEKDLGALVRTNRHIYRFLNPVLYELNAKEAEPQDSCVIWAAMTNNLETLRLAHRHGANLNAHEAGPDTRLMMEGLMRGKRASRTLYSPLHLSVKKGLHEITQFLLDHGASTDMPSIGLCNCRSRTFEPLYPAWYPLHMALFHAREGNISAELLIRYGARQEAHGSPGLSFQTVKRHPSLARLVASLGCLDRASPDAGGWLPLHLAASQGMDDILSAILDLSNVSITETVPGSNYTALHCAARQKNVNTTRLLLERPDTEINAVDSNRRSVVYTAAVGSNDESAPAIISLLVRHGANLDQPDEDGVTPLYAAASRRLLHCTPNFMAMEALLTHGANPFSYQRDANRWTIYHHLLRGWPDQMEVVNGRRDALLKLIDLGVEFDIRTRVQENGIGVEYNSDATPLFFAAAHAQDAECTEILLKAGARATAIVMNREFGSASASEQTFLSALFRHMWGTPNRYHNPPLSKARPIIALLLKYGARLEPVAFEESPLAYACSYPRRDYALLDSLLKHASNKNITMEHLGKLIADNRVQYGRCPFPGMIDHFDAVFWRLVEFREREFPG